MREALDDMNFKREFFSILLHLMRMKRIIRLYVFLYLAFVTLLLPSNLCIQVTFVSLKNIVKNIFHIHIWTFHQSSNKEYDHIFYLLLQYYYIIAFVSHNRFYDYLSFINCLLFWVISRKKIIWMIWLMIVYK